MASAKQQALSRLLDVSGPGRFNEETGTWMVGRRHHHHHRHVAPPPPPPPEPAPEPEAPEPSATTASPATTTPSGGFYPDLNLSHGPLSVGRKFSTTNVYPNYPYMSNYRSGTIRRNYIVTNRSVGPHGFGFTYTIAYSS